MSISATHISQNAGPSKFRQRSNSYRQLQRCRYSEQDPPCKALRCVIFYPSSQTYDLFESTSDGFCHTNHNDSSRCRGLPGNVRALITDEHLNMPPRKMRAELRGKAGLFIDSPMRNCLSNFVKSQRRHIRQLEMPLETRGRCFTSKSNLVIPLSPIVSTLTLASRSYAGLEVYLQKRTREKLMEAGQFNEHSVYVLGEAIVNPMDHKVCVALSSENLLLNIWRQQQFGIPSFLAVDTTHRLVQVCSPFTLCPTSQDLLMSMCWFNSRKDIVVCRLGQLI